MMNADTDIETRTLGKINPGSNDQYTWYWWSASDFGSAERLITFEMKPYDLQATMFENERNL